MIRPETTRLLAEFNKSPYAHAIKEFLDEEMKEIRSVESASDWEEVKANQKVIKIVDRLFYFLRETPPKVDKSKNQYK
jgi:hypothetical protein